MKFLKFTPLEIFNFQIGHELQNDVWSQMVEVSREERKARDQKSSTYIWARPGLSRSISVEGVA